MRFRPARAVADAVLFEGYVLYPYRSTSTKNRFRWVFGVLAPRAWSEAGGCEPWSARCQCLVRGRDARIEGRLRFLRVVRRAIEVEGPEGWREVDRFERDGELWLPWEEGEVEEVHFSFARGPVTSFRFAFRASEALEPLPGARVVRRREALSGWVRMRAEDLGADLWRMTIEVENRTAFADPGAPREVAVRSACVGAHLLLAVDAGAFVSLTDPPEDARAAAASCRQHGLHPVLAGLEGTDDLVLAAPIVLYDHPRLAPESAGDFFDATEIDEILTLRTATLTEDEKREVRATDPRSARLLDRVELMPPAWMERLHGALRDVRGGEMVPRGALAHDPSAAAEVGLSVGQRVRLRPGPRRTDAQDALFAGQVATIRAVLRDVDGAPHLALTLDEDPGAELHHWYGRFHYYRPDEVEPLAAPTAAPGPQVPS